MRDKTKPFLASAPRIVLVDGTSAASPFPSTAHVVTDVTEKAHFSVHNGVASICFAQVTKVIFR